MLIILKTILFMYFAMRELEHLCISAKYFVVTPISLLKVLFFNAA